MTYKKNKKQNTVKGQPKVTSILAVIRVITVQAQSVHIQQLRS